MIDTRELEVKVISCVVINPELLNEFVLDEKYFFNTNKVLNYLTEFYRRYRYISCKRIVENAKDQKKTVKLLSEYVLCEISWKNIYGYYKELREVWKKNEITKLTDMLKNNEMDNSEFTKKMNLLNKEDFEENELLTVSDIQVEQGVEREYTNIAELDYLLKGIEYGKLSLWSGITNHGKTTLMIQFAKECIKKHKKIFYFSGEQTSSEFKNYLYVGLCTKEQLEFTTDKVNSKIYDTKPKKEVLEYFDNIYKDLIYIYNNNIPDNNINIMLKVMNKAFNKGVRIFFIDNFMQLDNSEKLEEQTKIVESFKRFARDKNVIINLVAHPRKTQFQKNRLTIFDISGTQNIANKSSNICTIIRIDILSEIDKKEIENQLWKNNYDINKCDGVVEVLKTKGNACKMVGLVYNLETKTYKEAPKGVYTPKKKTIKWEEDDNE